MQIGIKNNNESHTPKYQHIFNSNILNLFNFMLTLSIKNKQGYLSSMCLMGNKEHNNTHRHGLVDNKFE